MSTSYATVAYFGSRHLKMLHIDLQALWAQIFVLVLGLGTLSRALLASNPLCLTGNKSISSTRPRCMMPTVRLCLSPESTFKIAHSVVAVTYKHTLTQIARFSMNTHINSPEIVVIGYGNNQKTAIIEAFLGHVLIEPKDILARHYFRHQGTLSRSFAAQIT